MFSSIIFFIKRIYHSQIEIIKRYKNYIKIKIFKNLKLLSKVSYKKLILILRIWIEIVFLI